MKLSSELQYVQYVNVIFTKYKFFWDALLFIE